jgi:hypothetical protein
VVRFRSRFRAEIKIDGKKKYLGTFDTPEDAHVVYATVAREHHGEFAHDGFSREPAWTMNMMLSFGC